MFSCSNWFLLGAILFRWWRAATHWYLCSDFICVPWVKGSNRWHWAVQFLGQQLQRAAAGSAIWLTRHKLRPYSCTYVNPTLYSVALLERRIISFFLHDWSLITEQMSPPHFIYCNFFSGGVPSCLVKPELGHFLSAGSEFILFTCHNKCLEILIQQSKHADDIFWRFVGSREIVFVLRLTWQLGSNVCRLYMAQRLKWPHPW